MIKIALIMLGGCLGALCRYGITVMAAKFMDSRFPWGTLVVNLIGCFLIGVIFALAERSTLVSPSMRLMIMTGFLGALTTFSTYALEMVSAWRTGASVMAVTNFLANNVGGALLVLAGMWLTQLILERGLVGHVT